MNTSHKPIFTSIQKDTFVTTFILLISLMLFRPLAEYVWNVKSKDFNEIPLWYKIFTLLFEYILVSVAIWLNRNNLSKLNIDKSFVRIFIFTGILISIFYLPMQIGIIVFLITLAMFGRLTKNGFEFNNSDVNYSSIALIFISGLIPVILLYISKMLFDVRWVARQPTWTDLNKANLPQVLFEEIAFRGLLWACLGYLGVSDNKTLYIQDLLFWILHIDYWSNPIMFWFWLPLVGLWLGLLVLRTKSLTLSTIGHFLFNLFAILLR